VSLTLRNKLPQTEGYTRAYLGNKPEVNRSTTFDRLHEKPKLGGIEGKPNIPETAGKRKFPTLKPASKSRRT
jgi:hypothetical protein